MGASEHTFTADQVRALLAGQGAPGGASGVGIGAKAVQNLWGADGLFSTPGLNPYILSTIIAPNRGLRALIPWRKSAYEQDILGVLTGVTASTGANPTAACVPGPTPGKLKICQRYLPFGQIKMSTDVASLTKVGRVLNRATMIDPRIMNDPFAPMVEAAGMDNAGDWLENEIKANINLMFFAMDRDYAHLDKDGDPGNTAENDDDAYQEYFGTDYQINTGYRDAKSGRLCPAVDSYIWDMGGLSINDNGPAYVQMFRRAMAYAEFLADRLGLAPVTFGIRGTLGQYQELAEIWTCSYGTTACSPANGTNNTIFIDGGRQVAERDAMLQGMYQGRQIGPYLPINGNPYPFIIEDHMGESNVGNVYTGEIEIIPLASPRFVHPENPGGNLTFFEYFDWDSPMAGPAALRSLGNMGRLFPFFDVQRQGRTLVYALANEDVCVRFGAVERYRLVIAAPFLAQRVVGVEWTQQTPSRDPIPGMPNHYNGGGYDFIGYTQQLYTPRTV